MPDQTRNLNSVTDFTGTLDSNDRIIMTDNKASLKALTTAILGKAIVEGYTGSSLAGSSQSVKSAIDGLNSKIPTIVTDASDTITATGCAVNKVYIVRVGAVLYASIRFTTTEDIAISSLILDGFPRALTNYTGAQNVRLYDHTSERFFDAQITHSDGASKSYLSSMEAIPSGHQIRGTFSYIASF